MPRQDSREGTGTGKDGRRLGGLAGGFAGRGSASSLMVLAVAGPGTRCPSPAEPALPHTSFPQLPLSCSLQFWYWGRETSQSCLVPTATPSPRTCLQAAVSTDASSQSQRFPTAPVSSTQSLVLVLVSHILSLNQSCHLDCSFLDFSFIFRTQETY